MLRIYEHYEVVYGWCHDAALNFPFCHFYDIPWHCIDFFQLRAVNDREAKVLDGLFDQKQS